MTKALKRCCLIWPICLLLLLLTMTAAQPAFGHGTKGERVLLLYDLHAMYAPKPVDIMAISDAYQTQLLGHGAQSSNECLRLQMGPVSFSWDETPALPPAGGQSGNADYMVWGEYFGGDANTVNLFLATHSSRKQIATGRGISTGNPNTAALQAALQLITSGKGSLLDIIYDFEIKTREQDTETALGPSLEITGLAAEMAPGKSATITISLKDCDGYLLAGRKVAVWATKGRVSAGEVVIGDDGTAQVTYTAPSTKADDDVVVAFEFRYPSDKNGLEKIAASVSVRDPKPEDPSIFHVTLEMSQIIKSSFQSTPGTPALFQQQLSLLDSLDPLKLEFDVNQRMEVVEDSLKASYHWTSQFNHGAAAVQGQTDGTDSSGKLVDWEIVLKRHIDPVAEDQGLKVYDADEFEKELMSFLPLSISQPEDTLLVDYMVVIPAPVTGEYNVLGEVTAMDGDTDKSYEDTAEFDYDYRNNFNSDKLNRPSPTTGLIQITKNEISYTMELKNVKFEFLPSTSPTVTVDDDDYSDKFKYVMYWREWTAPINTNYLGFPRASAYRTSRPWTKGSDGCTGGYSGVKALLDELGMIDGTDKPPVRILREYLVAVEGFPEFGYWYGLMSLESFGQVRYVVNIYEPIKIDAADWKKIKTSKAPHRDENSAGEPARYYAN